MRNVKSDGEGVKVMDGELEGVGKEGEANNMADHHR